MLGSVLVVSALAACTVVDSVSGFAGPPLAKDAGADSGKPCVTGPECDDENVCTTDTCWGGYCRYSMLAGQSCSDGDLCNGDELCDEAGVCVHGIPPEVEDDDLCTVDACDSKTGVQHVPGNYPPITFCTFELKCPPDYFLREILCSPDCPPSGVGVNAATCERICKPELTVCCNDCTATTCPAGYQPSGYMSSTCVCGQPASGLICKR